MLIHGPLRRYWTPPDPRITGSGRPLQRVLAITKGDFRTRAAKPLATLLRTL